MIINNVGYNHSHDVDFLIERPKGSGDYLLLLLKTDCIFTIDGKDVSVEKNTVFLFKKGTPQYYRSKPKSLFSNDWVHFDFERNEAKEYAALFNIPYDTPVKVNDIRFFSYCVKSLANECSSHSKNMNINIKSYMTLIFSKLEEAYGNSHTKSFDDNYNKLLTIRNKMFARPYESRSVDATAHELSMSRSSFQHLYKKYFGKSFMQEMIQSRVEYAEMLLASTNMSISEISQQCGYRTYVNFIRQFSSIAGKSPKAYRLECRKNNGEDDKC